MAYEIGFRWLVGRGIIATGLAILAAIPTGCRVHRSNRLKDARQELILVDRRDRLDEMKREQYRLETAIEQAGKDKVAREQQLAAATARILPLSTELGEKLRFVKTMEEDLAAAKKRIAELEALQKQAAAATARLAETNKAIQAADAQHTAQQAALAAKTAAVAELGKHLATLTALETQLKQALTAAGAKFGPPPAATPAATPAPAKPVPAKPAPAKPAAPTNKK